MKIVKYDNESKIDAMVEIAEQSRKKFYPNNPPLTKDRIHDVMKTIYVNSTLEADSIFAMDDDGKVIGFAGLMRTEVAKDPWILLCNVLPEVETEEIWTQLITTVLNQAKEQNAPGIKITSDKMRPILNNALKTLNFTPDHYIYSLNLKNLNNIPKVTIPKGIEIKVADKIIDPKQHVSVMNEAYENKDEWIPDTPENIQDWEAMQKKTFDPVHFYAYKGKKIVGACNVLDSKQDNVSRFIGSIGVRKKYQNQGIGEALMGTALQNLNKRGNKMVQFNTSGKNTSDIELPTKFGFEEDINKTQVVYKIDTRKI
ncbi:hypothetical protein NEF87_002375 [Candidatus Lokiarchaeum ossiferum]|uniref:N-acetyltransferase domain-containing protein n=1 Tax=Candidatus Lokiarchaeum ossiferum TaxID=2951803 RepID=A0ABY6HRF9_9ARCH|nr:hypothetical protein NEF87_002375 [Candidatus Lokiarchaeum sp. B-35]